MKTSKYWLAGVGVTIVAAGVGFAASATAAPTVTPTPVPSVSATSLDPAVTKQLRFLREEERLAHDVYAASAALYPANATQFTNIANAEQRHFDAMGVLLTRYGLTDPSAGRAAGSYADPALTTLYTKLMTQAKVSLTEAYKVGVAVETSDLADLKSSLSLALPADAKQVFTNLQAASNNHLAMFTALRDGKAVAGMGGMGRGPNATATPGTGMGMGPGHGVGRNAQAGTGAGTGRNANPDCPLR